MTQEIITYIIVGLALLGAIFYGYRRLSGRRSRSSNSCGGCDGCPGCGGCASYDACTQPKKKEAAQDHTA